MKIRHLSLRDFRNYESLELKFNSNINIFIGDNAQGKTNLLEAIYLLSTGRSHRVSDEKLMIRKDSEMAVCKAMVDTEVQLQLKVVLHDKGKTLFYQNQPLKKSSEFIGKMNAVLFSPSDMDLFETSPKDRRKLFDVELGKINPFYMDLLTQYVKVLKDRNVYLKGSDIDEDYLEIMTTKLISLQVEIVRYKTGFVDRLNQIISSYYQRLSLTQNKIKIAYQGPVEWSDHLQDDLIEKYRRSLDRDRVFKMTHVGIHRDDYIFSLDNQFVSSVASQGQKRLIIVALKCALIEVIEEMSGDKPILLLDDVFSELDKQKRIALFDVLHLNTQTVITTTDLEDVQLWLKDQITVFEVKDGKVFERSSIL